MATPFHSQCECGNQWRNQLGTNGKTNGGSSSFIWEHIKPLSACSLCRDHFCVYKKPRPIGHVCQNHLAHGSPREFLGRNEIGRSPWADVPCLPTTKHKSTLTTFLLNKPPVSQGSPQDPSERGDRTPGEVDQISDPRLRSSLNLVGVESR